MGSSKYQYFFLWNIIVNLYYAIILCFYQVKNGVFSLFESLQSYFRKVNLKMMSCDHINIFLVI